MKQIMPEGAQTLFGYAEQALRASLKVGDYNLS